MKIVGCDLHATQQTIAMVDTEAGEFTGKILSRERNAVQAFCAVNNGDAIVLSWQQNSSDALMVYPRNAVKKRVVRQFTGLNYAGILHLANTADTLLVWKCGACKLSTVFWPFDSIAT